LVCIRSIRYTVEPRIEIGALFNQAKLWDGVWPQILGQVGRAPHLMLLTPSPERDGSSVDAGKSVDDVEVEVKEESKAHVDEKAPTPLPEPKEPPANTSMGPTGRISPVLYGLDSIPRDSNNKRGHMVSKSTTTHPRDRLESTLSSINSSSFTRQSLASTPVMSRPFSAPSSPVSLRYPQPRE